MLLQKSSPSTMHEFDVQYISRGFLSGYGIQEVNFAALHSASVEELRACFTKGC